MSINNPSVFAVNGQQGDINLTPTDLGLGNVPNVDATARANHTGTQTASTISDFTSAASAAAPVQSVASKTGIVTLDKNDVGLSNVDNTSDINKPISTATQTALNLKYDASNPSEYQTAAQVTATVNAASTADRARANHTGTQLASTISDFNESVDDRVASLLVAGTNVTLNYNDVANTLTINSAAGSSYTDEQAQDAVGSILVDSSSVDFTYDDVANTITAAVLPAGVNHNALQNYVANQHVDHSTVAINAGAGLTGGGDITISRTISMPNVGTAGTFGSATQVPVFTTDAQGRVSAVTNTSIQIAQSQVTDLTTDLSGKANLVGGNTFTGNQNLGGTFVNITPAPLNMVNSASGALRTQLNLVNTGGGGGAGSAIDFFTYDVAGGAEPGARIAAIDDNFSAYFSFVTKNPGASNNAIVERMRITNTGQVGIGVTPVTSARLQVDSTTQGFLPPRMTSAQRLAIASPVQGLLVFDTNLNTLCEYTGTIWKYEYRINTTVIQSTTGAGYGAITELTTVSLEPGLYALELKGIAQSSATTTGIGLRLNQSTAVISTIALNWIFSQAGNGTDKNFEYSQTALGNNVTSSSVITANVDFPVFGSGVFRITTAGAVAVEIRTEVGGSAVSIRPDSSLVIKKVG